MKRNTDYDKYNLEWYVLNEENGPIEKKFKDDWHYTFHSTNIRPWNVFRNWPFEHAAIDLALDYYNGKFTLETLKKDNVEISYDYKTNTFGDSYVKPEVEAIENDFEAFKYQLMKELQYEEWSRTEYEICVAEWPPTYRNKDGERILVHYGEDHDPIDDVDMDKVDCYMQCLMNSDQFAKYVLMTVNGTLKTKAELENSSSEQKKK